MLAALMRSPSADQLELVNTDLSSLFNQRPGSGHALLYDRPGIGAALG
jgi:hypothetical protein